MGVANIAATNMEHLCLCKYHGYSQVERWGLASRGICKVTCEGHTSNFYKGDRDCSSASIDCWQEALIGTKYEGALKGAQTTSNMRKVFVESGLFEWKPMSFTAKRGDLYLREGHHVAMCLDDNPDTLGEFSISETGGITGKWGDQKNDQGAKGESHVRSYYDYPWDGILHYNGKADKQPETTRDQCWQCQPNLTAAQRWKLVKDGEFYKIVSKQDSKCLDLKGGKSEKMADGRVIHTYKDNGADAQRWKLVEHESGAYFIASKIDQNCVLDVTGGATGKRAYVQLHKKQTEKVNQWAQLWFKVPNFNGDYTFINAKSFYVLDCNPKHQKL